MWHTVSCLKLLLFRDFVRVELVCLFYVHVIHLGRVVFGYQVLSLPLTANDLAAAPS
jgi:hypothetical protein